MDAYLAKPLRIEDLQRTLWQLFASQHGADLAA